MSKLQIRCWIIALKLGREILGISRALRKFRYDPDPLDHLDEEADELIRDLEREAEKL